MSRSSESVVEATNDKGEKVHLRVVNADEIGRPAPKTEESIASVIAEVMAERGRSKCKDCMWLRTEPVNETACGDGVMEDDGNGKKVKTKYYDDSEVCKEFTPKSTWLEKTYAHLRCATAEELRIVRKMMNGLVNDAEKRGMMELNVNDVVSFTFVDNEGEVTKITEAHVVHVGEGMFRASATMPSGHTTVLAVARDIETLKVIKRATEDQLVAPVTKVNKTDATSDAIRKAKEIKAKREVRVLRTMHALHRELRKKTDRISIIKLMKHEDMTKSSKEKVLATLVRLRELKLVLKLSGGTEWKLSERGSSLISTINGFRGDAEKWMKLSRKLEIRAKE